MKTLGVICWSALVLLACGVDRRDFDEAPAQSGGAGGTIGTGGTSGSSASNEYPGSPS